jgi:hypothetical protein
MKRLLVATILGSFLAAGLATANPHTLRLRLDDSGMNYAAVDADNYGVNLYPDAFLDTAYLKLGYEDGILTVYVFNQPQPDQLLTLLISDVSHYGYASMSGDAEAGAGSNLQDSAQGRSVANIDDIPEISFVRYATSVNHLEIFHHKAGLDALVNLYHDALFSLGFTRVERANRLNPRSFVYQNGTDRLKMRFHSANGGVTLTMEAL